MARSLSLCSRALEGVVTVASLVAVCGVDGLFGLSVVFELTNFPFCGFFVVPWL